VIEPLRRQFETVFLFDLILRGLVVKPHALVCRSKRRKKKRQNNAHRQEALHEIPPRGIMETDYSFPGEL
jgi:hypothetical protein